MDNRDLEQILQEELTRLRRGAGPAKSSGLLDVVNTHMRTPSTTSAVPTPLGSVKPTLAAAPGPPASSSINKGYTLPLTATAPPEETKGSVAGDVGKTALKLFTSGLGVVPLVTGLMGLFGGGESAAPPPLVKYTMPRPI